MLLYLLLLVPQVRPELTPISGFLDEYKLYNVEQYLKETSPKPTKSGPVLFPNDGPPPPKPPLIVTSRPLTESIARSELNNTVAEQRIDAQSYEPYYTRADSDRSYPLYKLEPFGSLKKELLVRNTGYNSEPFPLPAIYNRIPSYMSDQRTYHDSGSISDFKPSKQKVKYIKYYSSNALDDQDDDFDNSNNNYAFSYKVRDNKTGDDFSHSQHSLGSATTGEYRVRLPDGRTQIVSYTADENGYKADVRYDEAQKKNTDYTSNFKFDKNYDFQLNHNNQVQYNNNNNVKNVYAINDNINKKTVYNENPLEHDRYEFKSAYSNSDLPKLNLNNNEYNFQSIYSNQNQQSPLIENTKYDFAGQNRIDSNPSYNPVNSAPNLVPNYISNPVPTPTTNPIKPVKEEHGDDLLDDYGYADVNKEYNDEDLEDIDYDSKSYDYAPHRVKFNTQIGEQTNPNIGVIPIKPAIATNPSKTIDPFAPRSVRPTYDELKPLFVSTKAAISPTKSIAEYVPTKNVRPSYEELKPLFFSTKPPTVYPTITYNGEAKVEHRVPSTTPTPDAKYANNEDVVLIGGKPLYTNIKQSLRMFQEPVFYSTPKNLIPPVTPREFLVSTIANIRDRLAQPTTSRPILSQNFIDRINKYLKFV